MSYHLLSVGNDAKTVKGQKYGFLTGIMFLAPAGLAGGPTVCAFSTQGCRDVCLNTSGHGALNVVQQARIRRTKMFHEDPLTFLTLLRCDLAALQKEAAQRSLTPAVRLNGTSDILWEQYGIMEEYPNLQFYDYTKYPPQLRANLPPNYHLTYSLSEKKTAEQVAMEWLAAGVNVTIVFDTKKGQALPTRYDLPGSRGGGKLVNRFRVIDGDESDLRFTDPQGVIVGLRAKGQARSDDGNGFVRKAQ